MVALYLVFALVVGFAVRERAGTSRKSYFLADRSLPWWWAGLSVAATTFAADTPLAVTGIVADRGISGNWIWLSWMGVHAGVVVYFASRWQRADVVTDAEFVALRYQGAPARWLRWLRALLFGVVYNGIILGWVLRAMTKIARPFFDWQSWSPGLVDALASVLPAQSPVGSPAEVLTVAVLLAIVALYSSLGGIRGVVFTDLVQLGLSMVGSVWFAWAAWHAVGGSEGLADNLGHLYGDDHRYLAFFPAASDGWGTGLQVGSFAFGMYLFVQSYANVPSDGGGYLMQRLAATRSANDARRAALLFLLLQYVVRALPWLVVAVAALVLIPVGQETLFGDAEAATAVAQDRELAYPVLMVNLLPPVVLGVMVTSLLAAFMSTVDTHLNWGASYIVNDIVGQVWPKLGPQAELRLARVCVIGFALVAVFVSFHIDTIEQAWKWIAALGAALGVPTALRWCWWRVNAASEITAMVCGVACAAFLQIWGLVAYELHLVFVSAASALGLIAAILLSSPEPEATLNRFYDRVQPLGFWPQRAVPLRSMCGLSLRWLGLVCGVVALLWAGLQWLMFGQPVRASLAALAGAALVTLAYRVARRAA